MQAPAQVAAQADVPEIDPLAIVIEQDNLPQVVDDTVRVLKLRDERLFDRGGVLVRVNTDDEMGELEKPARVVQLTPLALAVTVDRNAQTFVRDGRTGKLNRRNYSAKCAQVILEEQRSSFLPLDSIAEAPFVTPDGRLLQCAGYDRATRVFLNVPPYKFEVVDEERPVSKQEARLALDEILDLNSGYPFEDEASEAVAAACLMTAVHSPGLPSRPAVVIDSDAPGSGKTLLAMQCGMLATGRLPAITNWPETEEERSKVIASMLLAGEPVLVIDNINGIINSSVLCAVITTPTFSQRLLGTNRVAKLPNNIFIVCTGVNTSAGGDNVRRTIKVTLTTGIERPESRRFEFNPLDRVRTDRARYVRAINDITRAYLAARPVDLGLAPFGGFEDWSRLVREPLVWLGMPDPCSVIERMAEIDPHRIQLRTLLAAVDSVFGSRAFTVAQLVDAAEAKAPESQESMFGRPVEPEALRYLREALETVAGVNGQINKKSLGKYFSANVGRVLGGLRFQRAGDKGAAGVCWCVGQAGQ